jgi:hypothetical protein
MYVGVDLHKNYLQIAVSDKKGKILQDSRIDNNLKYISRSFDSINSRDKKPVVVMESSAFAFCYCLKGSLIVQQRQDKYMS